MPADMTDKDRLQRLRAALHEIHWGAEALAAAMGIGPSGAKRLIRGESNARDAVLAWLERLAAFHKANPVPPPPAPETDIARSNDGDGQRSAASKREH